MLHILIVNQPIISGSMNQKKITEPPLSWLSLFFEIETSRYNFFEEMTAKSLEPGPWDVDLYAEL